MSRFFSVTVRQPDGAPIAEAQVCVNDRCGTTRANGRVRIGDISTDWHQVQLTVEADRFAPYSQSVNLDPGKPPFGDVEWPDLYLTPEVTTPGPLRVEGDRFMLGDKLFLVRGSTDFRIAERVLHGVDVRPILQDRVDAGANWLRILSMKQNNTGWELNPRDPRHSDMMRRTFDLLGEFGVYGEWVVFADTRFWMRNQAEQQDYYGRNCEVAREYPHILLELVNEDQHPTQAIDAQAFAKPAGILASHGSGLTDVQPVIPLWDYATYHARRAGANAKWVSNYSPYVFQDSFPTPCPYLPEEGVKPAQYGQDVRFAQRLGEHARCGSGGTFHHDAWNEPRVFTEGERACAMAFYGALETT